MNALYGLEIRMLTIYAQAVNLGLESFVPQNMVPAQVRKLQAKRCNASVGRMYEAHPGLSYAEVARREQRLADAFLGSESLGIAAGITNCHGTAEGCVTEPLHGSFEYCETHKTVV